MSMVVNWELLDGPAIPIELFPFLEVFLGIFYEGVRLHRLHLVDKGGKLVFRTN